MDSKEPLIIVEDSSKKPVHSKAYLAAKGNHSGCSIDSTARSIARWGQ